MMWSVYTIWSVHITISAPHPLVAQEVGSPHPLLARHQSEGTQPGHARPREDRVRATAVHDCQYGTFV